MSDAKVTLLDRIKQIMPVLLKLIVSALVLYYINSKGYFDPKTILEQITVKKLVIGTFIFFFAILITTYRLVVIFSSQKFMLKMYDLLKFCIIGQFFNIFLPGNVGGDVVKAHYLKKQGVDQMVSYTAVIIDRVFGLLSMSFFGCIAFLLNTEVLHNSKGLLFVFICLVSIVVGACISMFIATLFEEKLTRFIGEKRFVSKLLKQIVNYFNLKLILKCIVLSLVAQSFMVLCIYYLGHGMGIDMPLADYIIVTTVGFMVMAIPITPAGVGTGQAAFAFIVSSLSGGIYKEGAILISQFQIILVIYAAFGLILYLTKKSDRDKNS